MTKQEAIDILYIYDLEQAENGNEELCEALDMAIHALKGYCNKPVAAVLRRRKGEKL